MTDNNKRDKMLVSVNVTILLAFIFIFQVDQLSQIIKWTLLISFILYIFSLFLLIWNLYRYPIRMKLLDELREETIGKFSDRIASFVEEIIVPFSRLKAKDELVSRLAIVKTKEDYSKLRESVSNEIKELEDGTAKVTKSEGEEKAMQYVIESFAEQLAHASKEDFENAFKRPLKEKFAKVRLRVDRLAFRIRIHLFASASVFLIFSIFIGILSK